MGNTYAFGVDVGGTNIVTGLMSKDGAIVWKTKVATEPHKGNEHVVERIANTVLEGMKVSGIAEEQLAGVGIGMPGILDTEKGISIEASNLHFRNYPLAANLKKKINLPVTINNDVRMYMYGEAMHGAGKELDYVLGLTLGTGMAAAFITKGDIFTGGGGLAGEMGHIPIDGVKHRCNCGLTGCLETVVSATGIARQAKEAVAAGKETVMSTYYDDPDQLTAADVSRAYDAGDDVARSIMQYTGELLGRALTYIVPLLSPDIVVVGGGAALAGERLLGPTRDILQNYSLSYYSDRVQVAPAVHIDDAGVIGSASWAFKQLKA